MFIHLTEVNKVARTVFSKWIQVHVKLMDCFKGAMQ